MLAVARRRESRQPAPLLQITRMTSARLRVPAHQPIHDSAVTSEILDWLTAAGTTGAAVFAGWAAISSASAVRENRRLVNIERQRDFDRTNAERTEQAKRVSVVLSTQDVVIGDRPAIDFYVLITNSSSGPLFRTRLRVDIDDKTWGPQLITTLGPGERYELNARLYTPGPISNANASVRFVDANERAWVATARTGSEPAGDDLGDWIAAGKVFATRPLDPYERGTVHGGPVPDFEGWRKRVEELLDSE
jgi:hypothetical protein